MSLLALCPESFAVCPLAAAAQGWPGSAGRRVLEHFPGAVSADRRFVTYTDWSTGDLALRDLESGATRHLTHKGTWETPEFAQAVQAISPDGKYAGYGWQGPSSCDLRIVELAGSQPRILHQDDEIAHVLPKGWSPDGEQIRPLAQALLSPA